MSAPMPRPRRRAWTITAVAFACPSVLLVVVALASFRWCLERGMARSWWTLENARLRIGWLDATDPRTRSSQGWKFSRSTPDPLPWRAQLPQFRLSQLAPPGATFSPFGFLSVPLWIPVLALASLSLFARRVSRRLRAGFCPRCGYDLRAIRRPPDGSVVCPECGAAERFNPP